jgi:hypothetical protein
MRIIPLFILFLSAALIISFPLVAWSLSQLETAAPIDW